MRTVKVERPYECPKAFCLKAVNNKKEKEMEDKRYDGYSSNDHNSDINTDSNNDIKDTEPNFILYPSEEEKAEDTSFDDMLMNEYGAREGVEGGAAGGYEESSGGAAGGYQRQKGFVDVDIDKKRRAGKKKKKTVSLSKKALALLLVICIAVSGAVGFGASLFASQYFPYGINSSSDTDTSGKTSSSTSQTGYDLAEATGSKMTVKEIADAVEDSIVEISTEGTTTDSWMQQYITSGAGSGIIIKSNGYIMTNNHVIEGANKIKVTLHNDKEYQAEVVGTDAATDIAVLKISAKGLKAVTYGNSEELDTGDMAVVIGNPLGELGGTVTAGIISEPERKIAIEGQTMSLIQTDASINPGNSGGGMFNQYGQLIGVIEAKSSGSDVEGLGFAIPVNTAAEVAQNIIDGKSTGTETAFSGMAYGQTGDSSSEGGMEDFFGFGEQSMSYVYIAEIDSDNAKKAGFKVNDIVLSIDGEEVDSVETLKSIITSHKPGDKVKYQILRGNQTMSITLKLGKAPN